MRPQVGQVINNKYRLLRLIGDGGMGSVYEARHEVLGTSVALKFLHAELSKRTGLVQRFLQEARVSAQIQSPHVVRVTDVDQTPTGAFIVMEYIEGKTLQTLYEDLYKAGLQLSYTDALEYAMQMLEGVGAAHESGIVHRDLKPDNVMITVDVKGRALIKLLDFGIAKLRVSGLDGGDPHTPGPAGIDRALTRPGVIMGTPEYMAPEQAFAAEAVDARADIFSLGVIIFEMLAGRRPVGGEDPHQIASAYLSGQIAGLTDLAPGIDAGLAVAVHRAMAPVAKDRWATIADLRDAMEPFAVAAKAPSVMPSTSLSRVSLTSGGQLGAGARSITNGGAAAGDFQVATPAGQRAVPKTLPPEDEAPPGHVSSNPRAPGRDATSPAEPPRMSDAPQRGPTPLGGFGPFGDEASHGGSAVPGLEARAPIVSPPIGPPFIPPTRSVVPLGSGRGDPAATALASPMGLGGGSPQAATPLPPFVGTPRPSGTAIGDRASHAAIAYAGTMAAPGYDAAPGPAGQVASFAPGQASHASPPGVPQQAAMAAMPFLPPVVMGPKGAAPPKRSGGPLSSLPAILLLAAGVATAVVGGVYIAHSRAKADDHEDPPIAAGPHTSVTTDPPPPDDDDPSAPPAPSTTVAPWRPSTPSLPSHPPPRGSAGPVAPPRGSAGPVAPPSSTAPQRVPIIPSILPPMIIPSTLPWDFPLLGPPRQQPDAPRGQPAAPRAQPTSPRGQRPAQPPAASRPRPPPPDDEP